MLYPLRFEPLFRQYIWGGRRLGTVLQKPIGDGNYAESWEIVDHGDDQSVVRFGEMAGTTLRQLVTEHGAELFGDHHPQEQFPLLFKFLDCNQDLSVQVHPNDEQGAKLDPPDRGKTEAWVILDAAPGSKVYAGLNEGVDHETFATAIEQGKAETCLRHFTPKSGDCLFIKAGTVHALGAGLLVAEIQQASDTTFRLFDWNRVGADGKSRELHVEQGLAVTDFAAVPVGPQIPKSESDPRIVNLVECDKFVLNRWTLDEPRQLSVDKRFRILAVVSGTVNVSDDPSGEPLSQGQTILIPACCEEISLSPIEPTTLLEMHLPQ